MNPKVRITFELEEIKALCNALCHVLSDDLENQDPRSMVFVDPELFLKLKSTCFTAESFLLYPRIQDHDFDPNVEVIK